MKIVKMILEEITVTYFKTTSKAFTGGPEENHE